MWQVMYGNDCGEDETRNFDTQEAAEWFSKHSIRVDVVYGIIEHPTTNRHGIERGEMFAGRGIRFNVRCLTFSGVIMNHGGGEFVDVLQVDSKTGESIARRWVHWTKICQITR